MGEMKFSGRELSAHYIRPPQGSQFSFLTLLRSYGFPPRGRGRFSFLRCANDYDVPVSPLVHEVLDAFGSAKFPPLRSFARGMISLALSRASPEPNDLASNTRHRTDSCCSAKGFAGLNPGIQTTESPAATRGIDARDRKGIRASINIFFTFLWLDPP